jgi:hypothetical protein
VNYRWEIDMIKRYNFDRFENVLKGGKYAEGIFVHAESILEAYEKARMAESTNTTVATIVFRDNKPCCKNVQCEYCNPAKKEKKGD